MSFRIKDGFTVGTTDIVNSSGQVLVYQKDTTTIGQNLSKIPDVTQISFIRVNADETVDALSAADFRTAIDAIGTGSTNFLSSATNSTQDGYFGNIALRDDSNPSHYLILTNTSDLSADRTLSINPNNADRTISLSGNLTLANSLTTSGNNALTFTTTGATNVTLPTSGTLAVDNQTMFIGTTSVAINRSSGAFPLTGITSISNQGNILITTTGTTGGTVTVTPGSSSTASSSAVNITGATTTGDGGTGGTVNITGGIASTGVGPAVGGDVVIAAGAPTNPASITKTGGSVYIDAALPQAGGTVTSGSVFIGNKANTYPIGTAHVTIGKSGTEVRLPGVGTSGFVKLGANGALSADTATYLATTGGTLTGNLTVGGDLVVNGTLTTVNSNTLTVNDKNLELASVDTVTGLGATLVGATNSVTLTAGTTNTLVAGQKLTKTGQTGAFGTGTGLTLNTTTTAGALATATVNAGGTLYSVGDVINVSGGTGGQVTVTSTNGVAGVVTGVTLTTAGSGYAPATGAATTVATAAGPWILSISSSTAFTTNVNHSTAGWIQFSSGAPTNLTADGGGITLKGTTDKTIVWDNANTNWTSSEHWNIASSKTFKINNTTVLSSTQVLGRTPGGTGATDLVTRTDTQTLTNKSLLDSTTIFTDSSSKFFRLNTSSIGGSGATFTVSTNGSGQISAVAVASAGSGYKTSDKLTIEGPGSPSAKHVITVSTVNSSGGILTFNNDNALPFGTGYTASQTSVVVASASGGVFSTRIYSAPAGDSTLAAIELPQIFTAAQTFRAASSIRAEAAATQDAVVLAGRAGGTSSFAVTLTPLALSANRTISLPDVTGTAITSADSGTVTSTMIADGTIVNGDINASAAIAVSKLAASTISGVTLGNNLNTLTIGTGLTGTSYNGSSAVTIAMASRTLWGQTYNGSANVEGSLNNVTNITGPVSASTSSSGTSLTWSGRSWDTLGATGTLSSTADLFINPGPVVAAGSGATVNSSNLYLNAAGIENLGGVTTNFGKVFIGTTTNNVNSGASEVVIGKAATAVMLQGATTVQRGLSFGIASATEIVNVTTIASTSINSTAVAVMDSWSATNYRSASYIVQVTQSPGSTPEYYSSKIAILHDGTTTTMTEYEVLETGTIPITFTSDISGGNVRLLATLTDGNTRNATVALHRTLVRV